MKAFRIFNVLMAFVLAISGMIVSAPPQVANAAGTISLTTFGSAYTQDFNTLSNAAGTTNNVLSIPGWELTESGGGARDNEQYAVDTGGSNTGDTFSYGLAGDTDRALGSLRSGTLIPTYGAQFTNNTGGTITSLTISYTGEQWRLGLASRPIADRIDFQLSTDATSLSTGTWTDYDSLDFSSPILTGTVGALDGNNSANRTAISYTISSLSISNGATFWIRWSDSDVASSDDGLAVDNLSLTANGFIPDAAPTVSSTSPANGATGVSASTAINATFSEAVYGDADWLSLDCGSGAVSGAESGNNTTTLTFTPAANLPEGASCTATITAAKIHDTDTNDPEDLLAADYTWSFQVFAANPPPTASSTLAGDADVAVGTNIDVTFSEPVDVTAGWYSVSCASSGAHTVDVTTTDDTNFTLNPVVDFGLGELCTVTIDHTKVTDRDTTPAQMASDYVFNFTTVFDPAPAVNSVAPLNAATNVPLASNLTVNFSEAVDVASGWYGITCASSGAHTAVVSGGPTAFTLDPVADFVYGEVCTVTLDASKITDQDTADPYDAMASNYSWSFTATNCGNTHTLISAVQGSGASSPVVNATVTVEGIVTADMNADKQLGGVFIQSLPADNDGNPATSEGLFLYTTNTTFTTGDYVRITGKIVEYNNLTEMNPVNTVLVCGTGYSVDPLPITLPVASLADYEAYEGMYVTYTQTLTVEQNYFQGRYGQLTLGLGRLFQQNNFAKTPVDPKAYLSMVVLDDGSSVQNLDPISYYTAEGALRAGDLTSGAITGVLDEGQTNSTTGAAFPYRYYRIHPTAAVSFTTANPRPADPPVVGGRIKVVGANVENYFTTLDTEPARSTAPYDGGSNTPRGADSAAEFDRQQYKIVAELAAMNADVYGLDEIESWDGANGGLGAPKALVDALNTYLAGHGSTDTYAFIADPVLGHFDSLTDSDSDYIQVTIIYKTQTVTPIGAALSVDDTIFDRSPMAQLFEEKATGERFSVVVNHFKSKSSCPSSGLDADQGDGQGCWNAKRVQQAEALLTFINTTLVPLDPDVIAVGDYNAYGAEDPILTMISGGLVNQMAAFVDAADRYSYVFDGTAGYLDHGLTTPSVTAQISDAAFWHINSDETSVIDYNTEFKKPGTSNGSPDLYAYNVFRGSDHDPVNIGLNLNTAPVANGQTLTTAEDTPLSVTLTATDAYHPAGYTWTIVDETNLHGVLSGTAPALTYTPDLNYNGPASFTFKVNDGLESNIATINITVTPVNDPPVAVDDAYTTDEDTPLVLAAPGVMANDSDPDATDIWSAALLTSPAHGTLVFFSDGSFTYTPEANWSGTDSFTYMLITLPSLKGAHTDPATVVITVNPVNDPPVAGDDEYSVTEAGGLVVAAPGVLANDSDVDTDNFLYVTLLTDVTHGTLTLYQDGSFAYIPDEGFTGDDSFTYMLVSTFGKGEYTTTATVTLHVTAKKAPQIGDQTIYSAAAFGLALPESAFADVPAEYLGQVTLTAKLADGSELPTWLKFDPATATFSGVPADQDAGQVVVKVFATDPTGSYTSNRITINVMARTFLPFIGR